MKVNHGIDPFLYRQLPNVPKPAKTENEVQNSGQVFEKILNTQKRTPELVSSGFHRTPDRKTVLQEIAGDPEKSKLYEAAREFESFFTEKMFREMKKNIPKNSLLDTGMGGEIFEEMLLTERVRSLNEQANFGLAEMMYAQLSRNVQVKPV